MEPPAAQIPQLSFSLWKMFYFELEVKNGGLPSHCLHCVIWTDQLQLKVNREKEKTAFLLIKATPNWVSIPVQCVPVCSFFCWTSQLQDETFDLLKCFSKSGSNPENRVQGGRRSWGSVSKCFLFWKDLWEWEETCISEMWLWCVVLKRNKNKTSD